MSTKIYNGFRLAEGTDLTAFKHEVRSIIDPLRDQEDLKLLAATLAKRVDERWLAGEPILPGAVETAYSEWVDAQSKMSVYDYAYDLNRFELSIGTDPGSGRSMVIARVENRVLLDAFEEMPEVEEYGYWNNTDSYPEGVTRGDWEKREAAWDRMLPGFGRISATMDTWTLRDTVEMRDELHSLDGPGAARILALTPVSEDRATNTGQDAYADYLHQEQGVAPMRAVQHVAFGRGESIRTVIDTIASYLPVLTKELLTEGSGATVLDPGYRDAVRAACASLYETDKTELARNGQ
ncbi:hypothetical protein IV500_05715 [Paeniglutamicibacter antarcticus]|uniref:Uncharacterized protein n=1 Tax=Arthrobacter terrae TaxID=2935737 RepID=A0A931CP31_9MICC|nr:hypothetical protein [Arthrobacter terrae]MBG0738919.1 hypothetical protein [Arthrobacter terrae]